VRYRDTSRQVPDYASAWLRASGRGWPAEFIYDNLAIALNIVHAAHRLGVEKLLYLGSSCIYPKVCTQPMTEVG
jgi:nucleoside-diphosphate-sugar epimerase